MTELVIDSQDARDRLLARFEGKVNKHGPIPEHASDLGPCWIWTACRTVKGYGSMAVPGTSGKPSSELAHRVSYRLFVGPFPEGSETDHLCRVRACVNPEHLEAVPHKVNVQRSVAAITHCRQGHPYEGNNLRLDADGHRFCRACQSKAQKRWNQTERGRESIRRSVQRYKEANRDEIRKRQRERARRGAAEAGRVDQKLRTHCPQGHEYTLENTYRDREGHRSCFECRRESTRRSDARRKAHRLAAKGVAA